jgi:hypothetical protein
MEQIPTVPLDISQSNDDNCEFIIISTGLGYIKDLATIWLEFITKSLLPSIPGKFTKICIYHFDPFLELSDIAKKEAQNNIIINITQKEIALSTSTRCIYSAYTGVGFKNNYFFKGQPHIFIDIAHIFKYNLDGSMHLSNHYGVSDAIPTELLKMNYDGLKACYIGYPCLEDFCNILFLSNKWFIIHENGDVITYFDKLKQHNIKYNPLSPHMFINLLMESFYIHYCYKIGGTKYLDSNVIRFDKIVLTEIAYSIISLIMNDKIKDIDDKYYDTKTGYKKTIFLDMLSSGSHPEINSEIITLYNSIDSKIK